MKCRTLLLFGMTAISLGANTVSVSASSTQPLETLPPGSDVDSCHQSGLGPVSCSIRPTFSDPSGRFGGHVEVFATAEFGLTHGDGIGFTDNAPVGVFYESSFGDYITVLGGSGVGSLVTHYQLVSSNLWDRLPGLAVSPFYRFRQGDVAVEHTPNLPPSSIPLPNTLTEDFDVSAPVVFGVPIPLAAGTRANFNVPSQRGGSLSTSSTAQLVGYTVLDSAGEIVAGAIIQRSFTTEVDAFVPEPGTLLGGIIGAVFIARGAQRSAFAARSKRLGPGTL